MRIKLKYEVNKNYIPLIYRPKIISLIKASLGSDVDKLYSQKITKPFTFSLKFNGKINNDKIYLNDNKITILFSFLENYDINILNLPYYYYEASLKIYNGLLSIPKFYLQEDLFLTLKYCGFVSEKKIKTNKIKFKTLSPILLETKDNKPILPDNPNFNEEFNKIHQKIINSLGYNYKDLKINIISWKKRVIKNTFSEFQEKTNKSIMYLTAFDAILELIGDKTIIKILYKKGIGNRTGEGFGMVDII